MQQQTIVICCGNGFKTKPNIVICVVNGFRNKTTIEFVVLIASGQKTIVIYDVFLLSFRFLALFFGYYFFKDIVISLMLFSIVGALFNILIFIYLLKTSKENRIAYG